ncbi:[Fe-Fe] hydrogenase large subunit C-terminal domain-containing protein [uncultured Dysosmobacter sp.]|uniref:[Fe-Fe] hydrogenase large subunit C-terminal domain-containing protein n=1 Tax=uncultured Dysosmobacter sp. TaxID=2591384 RepID=UPI002671A399|nr:[Fe-Fe] hydrogenase large subunit C-terminal domain-containing protein [uncultured Dysosmobacter sp.]
MFHCLSNGAVHGLINAKKLLADIEAGSVYYDLIEVMTCKTGCAGGAGQPYGLLPVKHQCSARLYEADRTSLIKRSESNPIATDMLKGMLKGRTHELLHVHYKNG